MTNEAAPSATPRRGAQRSRVGRSTRTAKPAAREEAPAKASRKSARASRAAERRAARAAARKEAAEATQAAEAKQAEGRRSRARQAEEAKEPDSKSSFAAPAAAGAAGAAAAAASRGESAAQAATDEIVVLSGEAQTTNARSIAEVAAVVEKSGVRMRAQLGKISLEQLTAPDETKTADLAIMQMDALDDARKNGGPALLRQLNFVARLYNQELHVVAHGSIGSVEDLNGRKIALGAADSPGGRTGRVLLERLNVKAEIVVATQQAALEQLRRGEVQAAIFVGGKPVPALRELKIAGLHFLPIPYKGAIQDLYFPARITTADYPDLVKPGADVDTVAIGTVLVALDARPGTKRYQNLARFTEAFFESFPVLREPPHHSKWREVNLAADVPGWRRFLPAQRWLDKAPAIPDQRMTDAVRRTNPDQSDEFKNFVQSRPDLARMSGPDQEKLFKEFLRWNKETGR